MAARKAFIGLAAAALLLVGAGAARQAKQKEKPAPSQSHATEQSEEHQHEMGAMQSMSGPSHGNPSTPGGHEHMQAHMKWTAQRSASSEDTERAAKIAETLGAAIAQYNDYRVAENDGYKPFHAELPAPMVHFTSNWQGLLGAFRFDPTKPTSLLYKKTANGGYELIGAMYTAPRGMVEDKLNERVPLSVARWHAHVNLCMPPAGQGARADWKRFGFAGAISTPEECSKEGGRFFPQIFGWMVHVYPYEKTTEAIWKP